jgi:2-phosphosulfolactate phosphatase
MRKRVVIDALPESAALYRKGYAVVAVDVIRATTTAVTAVALGRRCFPVASVAEALLIAGTLDQPLLAGELHGRMPPGFEVNNSPAQIAARTDTYRPLVLLSSSGTQLLANLREYAAAYVACFRNYRSLARHIAAHHAQVALIGAGSLGEFREEDQMCCAWIASALVRSGYEAGGCLTAEVIQKWTDRPATACLNGNSAKYLERSGQLLDLQFILSHVDDIDEVFELRGSEVVRCSTAAAAA